MGATRSLTSQASRCALGVATCVLVAALAACSGSEDGAAGAQQPDLPPGARLDIVEGLRAAVVAVRHPGDGGGSAVLKTAAGPLTAGGTGSFAFEYRAGPHGILEGGALVFQVSPYWGWSTPQVERPDAPGFTRVTTAADGVELEAWTSNEAQLAVRIGGRALRAGETIEIDYGMAPGLARVDRFADDASVFWFGVDADGDGARSLIADPPQVVIGPAAPAGIWLVLPSTRRVGETAALRISVLDAQGNGPVPWVGEIRFPDPPPGLELPASVVLTDADGGWIEVEVAVRADGVYFLRAETADGLVGESNPMVVAADGAPLLWADLQIHTGVSDGTGTPDAVLRYARDVAGLDVAALTDHDHWGFRFLDQEPALRAVVAAATRKFHDPGRFVALHGYEWTNWVYGHRHVLFFDDAPQVFSSLDLAYDTPPELWDALRGSKALTIAHHSAGGPVPVDWSFAPDPELEPVTEAVSVHGSSEAADAPLPIYAAQPRNWVRDQLDRGYRLGLIGSTDGHDGHPGLAQLASGKGGLAAILAAEPTRDGVYEALRARRVYATSGPRIVLRASLGGRRMGAAIPAPAAGEGLTLVVWTVAVAPLAAVEVIRSGAVVETLLGEGGRSAALRTELADLHAGEYVYVRVVQVDGHHALSSPFYLE
ncbi:MAG TPA: CehA/McbA family metallohydrolase [Planctomycetota bacterium]